MGYPFPWRTLVTCLSSEALLMPGVSRVEEERHDRNIARLKDNCCVEMVEKERIISVSTARPDGRNYVQRP